MNNWSFPDLPDTAIFTLRGIAFNGVPVLHVVHEPDDGAWQFIGWEAPASEEIVVIGLGEIIALDPSLNELADLPLGWEAWRNSKEERWERATLLAE